MTTRKDPQKAPDAKPVNLALQGGGAHGAFTWGILDCLLEDKRISIEAISGTSAGAMNAVVLADGLVSGGPDAAREKLRHFWEQIGHGSVFSPVRRNPFDKMLGNWGLAYSPAYWWFQALTQSISPYDFNPLNINPLRDLIGKTVDFDRVRACDDLSIFISATNVETGRVRVFNGQELTPDMVMASACLPTLFQAVEIDGQPYWDGGYMGNPVLFPFFATARTNDILIVQINPIERKDTPRTAQDILDRVNEISFNSSLLRELRAVEFVQRMLAENRLDSEHYRNMHIHMIGLHDGADNDFSAPSKFNTEPAFLKHLFDKGRRSAESWLDMNFEALGQHSTVDIRRMFQGDGYEPHQ